MTSDAWMATALLSVGVITIALMYWTQSPAYQTLKLVRQYTRTQRKALS